MFRLALFAADLKSITADEVDLVQGLGWALFISMLILEAAKLRNGNEDWEQT